MKRAFTLLELLVVVAIMGLLGTASIGGYRAMQRGMEERGVMQNVNALIRAAYQRAQIDRQPTAVYFWNETIRSRTADENEIVVGKAVAVRRYGRLSAVKGSMLVDEFADLDLTFPALDENGGSGQGASRNLMYLYPMEEMSKVASGSQLLRSLVWGRVEDASDMPLFLTGPKSDFTSDDMVPAWAFHVEDPGGVSWKQGMAYGMEFMQLSLPDNYIFGSSYSTSVDNPVRESGTLVFDVGVNSGNGAMTTGGTIGRKTIEVRSIRQNGADMKAEKVADSDNPEKEM